jgi:rRNA processing protein Gar1
MVFKTLITDVPMFNQMVSNQKVNGQQIGKIDEVFGQQNSSWFSVNPFEGIAPNSLAKGTKVYLDKAFILPLSYIQNCEKPKPKISKPRDSNTGEKKSFGNFQQRGGQGGFNRGPQSGFNRGNQGGFNRNN